jgi:ketosteroid isomerase-like protein
MQNKTTVTQVASSPKECIQRLREAINKHDLGAMRDCFEVDYSSTFPVHPDRAFAGHAQMLKNWSQIFSGVPDIHAELLRWASNGDTVWAEWEWAGTRVDGVQYLWRGVTIHGALQGRTAWLRLYMEPVQENGPGVDAVVRQSLGGQATRKEIA